MEIISLSLTDMDRHLKENIFLSLIIHVLSSILVTFSYYYFECWHDILDIISLVVDWFSSWAPMWGMIPNFLDPFVGKFLVKKVKGIYSIRRIVATYSYMISSFETFVIALGGIGPFENHFLNVKESMFLLISENKKKDGFGVFKDPTIEGRMYPTAGGRVSAIDTNLSKNLPQMVEAYRLGTLTNLRTMDELATMSRQDTKDQLKIPKGTKVAHTASGWFLKLDPIAKEVLS
ncbi:hypothetical protein M9H77_04249 [Catharanthus roseus]|uniref:Uncharacterized protein n=1 Tax=Catharanthus roseus TaxID=4058 RepID=A0ACC0CE16_CATRO|nr:hypothetical protein M9H77_04249 [Catharanthus roseus]